MGFPIPELTIESVIREGYQRIKDDIDIILADVFSPLVQDHVHSKYGERELTRIKTLIQDKELPIHHATHLGMFEEFGVSIEFLTDNPQGEILGGGFGSFEEDAKTPDTIVSTATLRGGTPYDTITGIIDIDDSVNLTNVYPNHVFKDAADAEFTILKGVVNVTGSKQIVIATGATVDVSGAGSIVSSIDYTQYETHVENREEAIMVTAHAKDPLSCKYLYILLKYIFHYAMDDLIDRCFDNLSIEGVNYQQNPELSGDLSYMKSLKLSGLIEESWRMRTAPAIERAEINVQVEKDVVDDEIALREDQTVTIVED